MRDANGPNDNALDDEKGVVAVEGSRFRNDARGNMWHVVVRPPARIRPSSRQRMPLFLRILKGARPHTALSSSARVVEFEVWA